MRMSNSYSTDRSHGCRFDFLIWGYFSYNMPIITSIRLNLQFTVPLFQVLLQEQLIKLASLIESQLGLEG